MNKRRRFKAKRRQRAARRVRDMARMLRFHRYAFALVWPTTEIYAAPPMRFDVLYGVGWFDRLRDGVD